jgi:hypothetical protein
LRNFATASGAKTTTSTADQTNDRPTNHDAGWPSNHSISGPWVSARTALTITVIGWWSAKPLSQPGMDATGT